jgi:alanyl-tRNA synthetase
MRVDEVRDKYINFFRDRGHVKISGASLVPENDPTTLFTSSGMQQLVPYFLGQKHLRGDKLVNSQRCFRAEDIEQTGDNRHTTFFEMLGNWSLGSYFKREEIGWLFEFLTLSIGLDPERLYVSVFSGDKRYGLSRDSESAEIWTEIFSQKNIEAKQLELNNETDAAKSGMRGGRIFYYDADYNWWSRAGVPADMPSGEPGGPDTEVFYDFQTKHEREYGPHCHPNCGCGRFIEIGNAVFMEYMKNADGNFGYLPSKNVDFGGGLERITAASNDDSDIFKIDSIFPIIKKISQASEKEYGDNKKTFRIIADHVRAARQIISDGVVPSNTEQGYVLRRLIRRAVRYADKIGIKLSDIADGNKEISAEENKFRNTLEKGLKEFEKISMSGKISGKDAFFLFTTHGFPIEMTIELAEERGVKVETENFKKEMEKHQEISRIGAEHKFKGGLADKSEMSVKYHTATHLLLRALKDVLGETVEQRGSNITAERLRLDFAYDKKMTDEEKEKVENAVNQKIKQGLPVTVENVTVKEVKKRGIAGLSGKEYGNDVSIYKMGDYSTELCGGPHVSNTNELGEFKIKKEESVSAGVRRIKAVLE